MSQLISHLQSTASWVWAASWQATIIAAVVLAVQWTLGRRLAARWRNALWLLVFARLLMPTLPQARCSAYNWVEKKAPAALPIPQAFSQPFEPMPEIPRSAPSLPVDLRQAPAAAAVTIPARQVPVWWRSLPLLPMAWGIGLFVVLIFGVAIYLRTIQRMLRFRQSAPEPLRELFAAAKEEMGVGRAELIVSEGVQTPIVTGLLRPRIVVPAGLEYALSREDIRMVFLHELAHVKRGDLWMAWLASISGALHWFNPAIHFAIARARKDREMACDESVLRLVADTEAYGSALVRFLESRQPLAPQLGVIGIFESKSALLQRVRCIAGYRRPTMVGSVFGLAILAIIGAPMLTGASSPKTQAADEAKAAKAAEVGKGAKPALPPQEALEEAVDANDVAKAAEALKHGADANAQSKGFYKFDQITPLERAMRGWNLEMVRLLVANGADLRSAEANRRNRSFADSAFMEGHFDLGKYLYDLGPKSGEPLIYAAGTGDIATVTKLLPTAKPDLVKRAARAAAACNQSQVLAGLDLKKLDPGDLFEEAAGGGAIDSMSWLIEHGADLKKAGDDALQRAAAKNQSAAVSFLLKKGIGPNAPKSPGRSPLQAAILGDAYKVAKELLEAGADPNVADEEGRTPLACAAGNRDRVDLVQLLLDHGARVDSVDKRGSQPLESAVFNYSVAGIKLLLAHGAVIDPKKPGSESVLLAPFHMSGEDSGPIRSKGGRKQSQVLREVETFRVLLDNGADINAVGYQGLTPLSNAAALGHTAVFNLLLDRGADLNHRDDEGGTPLIRAIMPYFGDDPYLAKIDQLLEKGADINVGFDNPSVKGGVPSPLKAAMFAGLWVKADPGPSELEASRKLVDYLLQHGARFPVAKGSDAEKLLVASASGDIEKAKQLLARGVSPDVCDSKGWTPLLSACALGDTAMAHLLIEKGANVKAAEVSGLTPLWFVIARKSGLAEVRLLLDKGADPNASTGYFGTLMTMAIIRNDVALVRELLDRGADPSAYAYRGGDPVAPIHQALWHEGVNPEIPKLLLQYGADPNPNCYENRTPLYWAVDRNHTQTVKLLLEAGADPTKVSAYKESILSMAQSRGDQEIVKMVKAALEKRH
jgi:bla regulator protein BlaR1